MFLKFCNFSILKFWDFDLFYNCYFFGLHFKMKTNQDFQSLEFWNVLTSIFWKFENLDLFYLLDGFWKIWNVQTLVVSNLGKGWILKFLMFFNFWFRNVQGTKMEVACFLFKGLNFDVFWISKFWNVVMFELKFIF